MCRTAFSLLFASFMLTQSACGQTKPVQAEVGGKDAKIDIVGRYTYKCGIPGGVETGTVEVRKDGDTFKLEWFRDDQGGRYSGVAIRTGDILSICYSYPGAGERGVGAFTIASGPKLVGQWVTHGGDGTVYQDTWTPAK